MQRDSSGAHDEDRGAEPQVNTKFTGGKEAASVEVVGDRVSMNDCVWCE